MAEKPETTSRTKLWSGRISNASPHMLPLGAAVDQNNVRCQVEGQLDVRPGLRPVTFTEVVFNPPVIITPSSEEVIAMYQIPQDLYDIVIYELSDGTVKAGRSPSL